MHLRRATPPASAADKALIPSISGQRTQSLQSGYPKRQQTPAILTTDCPPDGFQAANAESAQIQGKRAVLRMIRSCVKPKDLATLRKIHRHVLQREALANDMYVATSLLTVYAKCGALVEARRLFDALPRRDVVAWNAIITCYSQNGSPAEVLQSFDRMRAEGLAPNAITFCLLFKACGSLGCIDVGEQLHEEAAEQGLLEHNTVLATSLVDMYANLGLLAKARRVLESLSFQNVASWNALITGYVRHGLGDDALGCFAEMREKGIAPNEVTFICALKACGSIERLTMGEEIHAEIRRRGLLAEGSNPMLGNAVLDMYAKCGMMSKARQVFEELCTRDVVSWNALVTGYAHQGLADEALQCFEQMQDEGIVPNEVTFIAILKACASVECLEIGERIHSKVRRRAGLLAREISLGVSLVDMYSKCGEMGKALEAFRELPVPSGAACNALISGYVQNGFSEEALSLFHDMRDEPIAPDAVTFSCVLKACANVGALEVGREIHDEVRQRGLVEKDIVLRTALADMYAKCGDFERAQEIFKAFPGGDIVSWNVIMAMYAQLGHAQQAFRLFGRMMAASVDITQDVIVFLLLLTVCSHAGLDKEARLVFERMSTTYCLTPTLDHYTCMIDLFGRAGQLSRAIAILEQAPPSRGDRVPLLLALMSACYKWFNVELGEWTFKQLIKLDEKCEAAYVCMGNIYAVAGMHSETEKLDALRLQNDVVYRVPRDLLVD